MKKSSMVEILWIRELQRTLHERVEQATIHHIAGLRQGHSHVDNAVSRAVRRESERIRRQSVMRRFSIRFSMFATSLVILVHAIKWPKMGTVTTPPLMTLDRIVRFFWSSKAYDRVFKPARADIVNDWEQAHIAGETKRAWYIKHLLGRWIILCHIAVQIPWSAIGFILKLLPLSK